MISFGAAGAVAYSTANGTAVSPAHPTGITAGQMLVLIIGQKPNVANGGTVTTPAGWTLAGSVLAKGGYATALAAGTGNTNLYFYTKVAAGSETGALAVTLAVNSVSWAVIQRFTTTSAGWDTPALASTENTASSISDIRLATSTALSVQAQDALIGVMVTASGSVANHFSGLGLTAGSLLVTATTETSEAGSTLGNAVGGDVCWTLVAYGSETATSIYSATLSQVSTNSRGPIGVLLLRENPVVLPTTDRRLHTEQVEVLTGGTSSERMLHTEQVEVLTGGPNADRRLHTQVVEVLHGWVSEVHAFESVVATSGEAVRGLDAFEVVAATSGAAVRGLDAFEVVVAASISQSAAPTNDLWVWNGTAEVPANVTVWNGTSEVAASVSVT